MDIEAAPTPLHKGGEISTKIETNDDDYQKPTKLNNNLRRKIAVAVIISIVAVVICIGVILVVKNPIIVSDHLDDVVVVITEDKSEDLPPSTQQQDILPSDDEDDDKVDSPASKIGKDDSTGGRSMDDGAERIYSSSSMELNETDEILDRWYIPSSPSSSSTTSPSPTNQSTPTAVASTNAPTIANSLITSPTDSHATLYPSSGSPTSKPTMPNWLTHGTAPTITSPFNLVKKISFIVMGDTPYTLEDRYCLNEQLRNLNQSSMNFTFITHVGDIKWGKTACTESSFSDIAEMVSHETNALGYDVRDFLIVPGDNEYQDCANLDEAWRYWMKCTCNILYHTTYFFIHLI